MKTLSDQLAAHLGGSVTTLAFLIKMTRTDGVVLGLTSHDRDIVFDGIVYEAEDGFSFENFKVRSDLKASQTKVSGILKSDGISEADLKNGLFDHAEMDVSICNWADLSMGVLLLQHGWLGNVTLKPGGFQANYMGLGDLLQRRVGAIYTPECRFCLGDLSCGLSLEGLSVKGSVTGVLTDRSFVDNTRMEADGFFDYGVLTWTSGALNGQSFDVQHWDGVARVLTCWLLESSQISLGDAYRLSPGCDKRFSTCQSKFQNSLRFGGFPHLAGLGKILQYPDNS